MTRPTPTGDHRPAAASQPGAVGAIAATDTPGEGQSAPDVGEARSGSDELSIDVDRVEATVPARERR
jgi:hypothetical protein